MLDSSGIEALCKANFMLDEREISRWSDDDIAMSYLVTSNSFYEDIEELDSKTYQEGFISIVGSMCSNVDTDYINAFNSFLKLEENVKERYEINRPISLKDILQDVKRSGSRKLWEKIRPTLDFFYSDKIVHANSADIKMRKPVTLLELCDDERDNPNIKNIKEFLYENSSSNIKEIINTIEELDTMHSKEVKYNSIEDFLTSKGIRDELIEGNRDVWDFVREIEYNEVVSFNQSYKVVDKDEKKWILKITTDEKKARMEAAANFYLSGKLSFIAPGLSPEPTEINSFYLTLQEDISDKKELLIDRTVDYWVQTLATFHREAGEILESKGIVVPDLEILDLDIMQFIYESSDKGHDLRFDKHEIKDSVDYLLSTKSNYLVHGDVKKDNRLGEMLIDLESCGKGNPAIDLALIFMQYNISGKEREKYLKDYLTIRGSVNYERELKELNEGINYAMIYSGCRECWGSHTRRITEQTKKDGSLIRKHILSIAA